MGSSGPSRRDFLSLAAGALTATAVPELAWATQVPRFDLLVKGGRVIDPSQGLSAVRDVGILAGRIARVAESIPDDQGRQILDARGKIVTPGLIDIHVHVYEGVARFGIEPDIVGIAKGVTSLVDGDRPAPSRSRDSASTWWTPPGRGSTHS